MRKRDLLERIEQLEQRVKELEARIAMLEARPVYPWTVPTYPTWPTQPPLITYDDNSTGAPLPPPLYRTFCEA